MAHLYSMKMANIYLKHEVATKLFKVKKLLSEDKRKEQIKYT